MCKLKLFVMPSGDRIRKTVNECKGDVFLLLPDKTLCNLKKDYTTVNTLALFSPKNATYSLLYNNEADSEQLFSLMY